MFLNFMQDIFFSKRGQELGLVVKLYLLFSIFMLSKRLLKNYFVNYKSYFSESLGKVIFDIENCSFLLFYF